MAQPLLVAFKGFGNIFKLTPGGTETALYNFQDGDDGCPAVRDWQPFSIVDGLLVTGQNPASSTSAAPSLIRLLTAERAA
jgi:putative intracellular protease/amidase